MENVKKSFKIARGISVANPVNIEKEYIDRVVDYAINRGYEHFQFIGPIHNYIRGNIDGMTFSQKYAQFNDERDAEYIKLNLKVVNEALDKLHNAGIKSYMWHHELDLPTDFTKAFPEILNDDGDVEVTHPLVRDYLENRIKDFFDSYPKMDGIILTLHETKIPLLKLKNQKLDKIGRVKYVTEILFNSCKERGKELVVRPFASIPEDYSMMLEAYESISKDLIVMDKWTQFDWSLTLPNNQFFYQIKNNPLLVETDIFGEYFGKGRLPIMLKEHIKEKVEYCKKFSPYGYVNRIDREGFHPFGTVNEVNLDIMYALMSDLDPDIAIDEFFSREYPDVSQEVKDIMSRTEEINRKLLNCKDYYFMQGSFFPELNHSKNHFYFDLVKKNCDIRSDEWFIPKNWKRSSIEDLFSEKDEVVNLATELLQRVKALDGKIEKNRYDSLLLQFNNLYYSAKAWRILLEVFYDYVQYFEGDVSFEAKLYSDLDKLLAIESECRAVIGDTIYNFLNNYLAGTKDLVHLVDRFVNEIKASFVAEKEGLKYDDGNNVDYVFCGGAMEGHGLKKEVNFSDTMLIDGRLCRIPGNRKGATWSRINGHGWFSYEVKVKPNETNKLIIELGSLTEHLDAKITAGSQEFFVNEQAPNGVKEFTFEFNNGNDDKLRIRIDRISPYTPQVYSIKIK